MPARPPVGRLVEDLACGDPVPVRAGDVQRDAVRGALVVEAEHRVAHAEGTGDLLLDDHVQRRPGHGLDHPAKPIDVDAVLEARRAAAVHTILVIDMIRNCVAAVTGSSLSPATRTPAPPS